MTEESENDGGWEQHLKLQEFLESKSSYIQRIRQARTGKQAGKNNMSKLRNQIVKILKNAVAFGISAIFYDNDNRGLIFQEIENMYLLSRSVFLESFSFIYSLTATFASFGPLHPPTLWFIFRTGFPFPLDPFFTRKDYSLFRCKAESV